MAVTLFGITEDHQLHGGVEAYSGATCAPIRLSTSFVEIVYTSSRDYSVPCDCMCHIYVKLILKIHGIFLFPAPIYMLNCV